MKKTFLDMYAAGLYAGMDGADGRFASTPFIRRCFHFKYADSTSA